MRSVCDTSFFSIYDRSFSLFFCSMRDPPLRGTLVRGIRNPNDQPSGQTLPSYSTLPRSHSHDQPQTVIRHTIILEHTCAESQDLSASRSTSGPPSPLSVLQVAWMLTECKARKPESNRSHGTGQTDMCTHTHKHTDRHVHTHARIPQARRIFIFIFIFICVSPGNVLTESPPHSEIYVYVYRDRSHSTGQTDMCADRHRREGRVQDTRHAKACNARHARACVHVRACLRALLGH